MISIIVPTYKRQDVFSKTLLSIENATKNIDCEVIIVNDDKDATLSFSSTIKNLTVLNNPKSGVASARNYGAKNAKGEILLFIDDDMIINESAINTSLDIIKKIDNSVVNVNWIYSPELINIISKEKFGRYLQNINFTTLKGWCSNTVQKKWKENSYIESDGIASYFLLIKKYDFEKTGKYDENFPFAGFEDGEFNDRLILNGYKPIINTQSVVFHNELDRLNPVAFLERKYRGGITQKTAVSLGFSKYEIKYSLIKKITYSLISYLRFMTLFILKIIPNSKKFDPAYTFIMNRMIGIYIYKGYNKK